MTISRVRDLEVFRRAYDASMTIYASSKAWPKDERFSLTDQVRRSSRALCANLAEAWAKRLYPRHFVSKLSDAHGEAEETAVWIDFARDSGYLGGEASEALLDEYRYVVGGLIKMMRNPTP